jgi:hypothetical protein
LWLVYCIVTMLPMKMNMHDKHVVLSTLVSFLQEALRIGDQIRVQRHAELLSATFKAWRMQVSSGKGVEQQQQQQGNLQLLSLSCCSLSCLCFVLGYAR